MTGAGYKPHRLLAGLTLVGLLAGCGRKDEAVQAPPPPPPLASVNGVAITAEDVAFEIERRREAGRPLGDTRAILDELIERQAMLQAARTSGLLDDPAVKRELENRELGQWLDRTLQIERDAVRVTDEELAAYYATNTDLHTRPAMSRIAILQRKLGATDTAETRAAIQDELAAARAAFLADPAAATRQGQLVGFGTIAASSSEDTVTRYRGGDLGWTPDADLARRVPEPVAAAAAALGQGEVSEVITTGDNLYVVLVIDRQPAARAPLTEVAPGLRRKLIREKQQRVEQTFLSNLLASAAITVDEQQAATLTVPEPPAPVAPSLVPVGALATPRGGSTSSVSTDPTIPSAHDE